MHFINVYLPITKIANISILFSEVFGWSSFLGGSSMSLLNLMHV